MPNNQTIRDRFDLLAGCFDQHSALHQEVGRRLIERTAFHRSEPSRILDLGCGTGAASAELKKSFRKAQLISVDTSPEMLRRTRGRSSLLRALRTVCADLGALPFGARSVDMVFSNLAIFWCADPMRMFSEFRRVLCPRGMLLFSTLGPSTFRELGDTWPALDQAVEFPAFSDILEVGDALTAAGFREPVMDTDRIRLSYAGIDMMLDELEATGLSLLIRNWDRTGALAGKLQDAWPETAAGDRYMLEFEIYYGVAFGPEDGQPMKTLEGDVATFSVDAITRQRR